MIETFLLCTITLLANNCETIHPDLDSLIPYHELNHLLIPKPIMIQLHNYFSLIIN